MTRREAVLTLYVVSFILGLLAIFVTQASVLEGYVVGALVVAADHQRAGVTGSYNQDPADAAAVLNGDKAAWQYT